MKTLNKTLLALVLLGSTSIAMASETKMPVYEVTYVNNIDTIKQQTSHTIAQLNYQTTLDIYSQAKNNVEYIGARLHLQTELANNHNTNDKVSLKTAK